MISQYVGVHKVTGLVEDAAANMIRTRTTWGLQQQERLVGCHRSAPLVEV